MSNNIEKLLSIIVSPSQGVEDALQQLKTQRFVDTAVGSQLDIIGRIVGQEREGLTDDDYRRYIRARIAVHNSNGWAEDLLTVAYLVVYDPNAVLTLTQEGTATARLMVSGVTMTSDLAAILFKFLTSAVSSGVRIVLEWLPSTPSGIFKLDVGPGFDQGHLAGGLG